MEAVYSIGNQGRIMRRLLGRSTVDSSHESASVTSSPLGAQYRPSASQNAVYNAQVPISAIDSSPNGLSAILAGRHILRMINLDGLNIKEGFDLRSLLVGKPDQLSITDVKWGNGPGSSSIFTACAGGKIFQYDLARASSAAAGGRSVDTIQMREDTRQINTLDINPHRGTWLLSGSQDGIVRCFDIRTPVHTRTGATFRAVQAFKCNADGVREVQWSPKDGFYFACCTEQGVVLKWDIRRPSAPVQRINAHDKTCSAIAWHPDGDHLVSAGWDSKCHVWDVSKTADKRQKPKWTISTPAPVAALAWRPGQWSATAQGKRASQIAVSYDESSQKRFGINAVHIWDLARPTMPYREIQRFDSSPSAILWHDQYLLWTAGQDHLFNQCDVTFAPKVIDRQAVSTLSFSPRGDVLMFLDERTPSHHPRPRIMHSETTPLASYSSSPATPRFSVSRSDSEDDVIGSFLGPRRRGSRKRRLSTRSAAAALSTTPPGSGAEEVMGLEQTIKVTGIYKPQQSMAIGHVPAAAKVEIYEYLTTNYLETLHTQLPCTPGGKAMPERIASILEHFATAAENVNQFRLAQTWRILAYGVDLILQRRAQYHFEARMENIRTAFSKKKLEGKLKPTLEMSLDLQDDGEATPRKMMSTGSLNDKGLHALSLITRELESTSNVPTPLARPIPDTEVAHTYENGRGKKLTPIIEPDSFTLPPAIHAHAVALEKRKRLDSEPLSIVSHDSENTQASTEGYDFYDTEAISKAIDVPVPNPKAQPVLDYRGRSPSRRKSVIRQDSDDSFAQVFSISNRNRRTTGLTDSSSDSVPNRAAIKAAVLEKGNSVASEEGEFGSRIRGQQIGTSPSAQSGFPFRQPLHRSDTGLTAFTDEHHLITQTTSDSFESPYRSQTDTEFLESPQRQPPSVCSGPEEDYRSPYIIEADYLHWPSDPPYPYPLQTPFNPSPPLQPYSLISRALAFEAKSSALNAAAIVLLLKPLVPSSVIDPLQAAAILRQHYTRLMSMKLFVEAALLRKLCIKGWPGGVLSSWGDDYPSIFTPAHQGVQIGLFCSRCHKPREINRAPGSAESVWKCERCKSYMAGCAICGHRDSPPDIPSLGRDNGEEIMNTWFFCHGCSHGGHSSCLHAWHASFEGDEFGDVSLDSSEGLCPMDGCGHACLPGRARNESVVIRAEEVTRAVRGKMGMGIDGVAGVGGGVDNVLEKKEEGGSVKSDGNEVAQSRAVESVRDTLGGRGTIPIGTGMGILSSSPGRERVERERRKSVKFVEGDAV
ncbi:hypothetical protein OQA88_3465 [Cercophora sp. LCS_1]